MRWSRRWAQPPRRTSGFSRAAPMPNSRRSGSIGRIARFALNPRQQVAPPFVHYACVDPADLDVGNAHAVEFGKFYHSLNIGRDEVEFGASIGCRERPCVREAIVYDSAQLPTVYRLASRFSVACFTRCEELVDDLRRLATAGGAPRSGMTPDAAEKIVQVSNAVAEETKPKWPSEPAPPFVRAAKGGPVALPFRTSGIFGNSLCTAAQDGNTTITYRCARLADLDASWLTNDECGATDTRRRDGSCVSGRSPYNSIAPIFPGISGSTIELPCRCGLYQDHDFRFRNGRDLARYPGRRGPSDNDIL